MRVMHGNIFTLVMCMNDYTITIQTFTNLEKVADCASRSPSMQRMLEILTIHKLVSFYTSCSRSVVVLYIVALTTLSLAVVRKQGVCTDISSEP